MDEDDQNFVKEATDAGKEDVQTDDEEEELNGGEDGKAKRRTREETEPEDGETGAGGQSDQNEGQGAVEGESGQAEESGQSVEEQSGLVEEQSEQPVEKTEETPEAKVQDGKPEGDAGQTIVETNDNPDAVQTEKTEDKADESSKDDSAADAAADADSAADATADSAADAAADAAADEVKEDEQNSDESKPSAVVTDQNAQDDTDGKPEKAESGATQGETEGEKERKDETGDTEEKEEKDEKKGEKEEDKKEEPDSAEKEGDNEEAATEKAENQDDEEGKKPQEDDPNSDDEDMQEQNKDGVAEGNKVLTTADLLDDGDDEGEFSIPEDFFYEIDQHVSKPLSTEDSCLPDNLLQLHHSFGFDSMRRCNLHVLDNNSVLFAAGNLAQLFNLQTKEQQYLRSTSGGGIGALAVHPQRKYFAVAEKGDTPNINVYEYPTLKLYRILRGGTERLYSYVDFSPDGRLLASVGGPPDFMLTIWDWKKEKTVLRSKAFSQDVFRVTFSTELQGQLTSCGTGHIRFWKMAKTFTGLKLQGELGKFGKTEISDIEGYVELPDGKVLSGSEWGNLLLWDGGLIKVEISRRGKKPCHQGAIQQIIMDEGELMTVGEDGYILVWDFETVDTADATDETAIFEMEPMNELKVGSDVCLQWMMKSINQDEPTIWYAQDARGGIWKLDLSFSFTSQPPDKLMSYHSGIITHCDTSPVSHLVASTGVDKTVRVYDYMAKTPLCSAKFNMEGSSLLWCPQVVDPSGSTILVGFKDGVVRALTLQKRDATDVNGRMVKDQSELVLKQAFKPHNGNVTALAIDSQGETLASGSDDNTVFFLSISDTYKPVGFIQVPSAVASLDWSPGLFNRNTLLVCCKGGEVLEVECPDTGNHDTNKTFQLENLPVKTHIFKSIKSRLRHEEDLLIKAQEEEEKRKKEEEERRIRLERGLEEDKSDAEFLLDEVPVSRPESVAEPDPGPDQDEHDSENESGDAPADSEGSEAAESETKDPLQEEEEEEKDDWEPYIPEKPSPLLQGLHGRDEGKFWISMGDFDAGYLYEYEFKADTDRKNIKEEDLYQPTRTIHVKDSNEIPITTIKFSKDRTKAFMGMEDGSLRIYPLKQGDIANLDHYWALNVHDNDYGQVTCLAVSHDDNFLFSVGCDGNFFTFVVMQEEEMQQSITDSRAKVPSAKKEMEDLKADDIDDKNAYSIEDAKQKSEYDKMVRLAEEKKAKVRRTIDGLRMEFSTLLDHNEQLPSHLQLNRKEFEMASEIKEELQRQTEEKIANVKREMAWEEEKHRIALEKLRQRFKDVVECERVVVRAFLTSHHVASFRAAKLSDDFYLAKAGMERRRTEIGSKENSNQFTLQDLSKGSSKLGQSGVGGGPDSKDEKDTVVMTTLKGSMGNRINKALEKVEEKKRKRAARRAQWEELYTGKPDDHYEDPGDVAAIKEAQENMGDYKLKSANDYVVPDHLRMNVDKAKQRLLVLKDLMHQYKYEFNQRLLSLRDEKLKIIEKIHGLIQELDNVQDKLAEEHRKPLPELPEMQLDEIPEKKFEFTREKLIEWKDQKKLAAKGGQGSGAFGSFGLSAVSAPSKNQAVASPAPTTPLHQSSDLFNREEPDAMETIVLSELEEHIRKTQEIRLLYERDRLLAEITGVLKNFDAELRCIRHDKFKVDVVLKNADLRHVTLFEELLLLKDFELREDMLASKVNAKERERTEMLAKVVEVEQKLEAKKKDLEQLAVKEKQLQDKFLASLGENNKFADFLTHVYKKKIKRSKKKMTEGEDSDEESDESDDDSELSESEGESDSEAGGLDLDTCPPGCDTNLYDNTCQLREHRLDLEDAVAEEKKTRDMLNKELEAIKRRAKGTETALKAAEHELEAFQLEKQQKLNELDVVATLYFHQIQHVVNGLLPQDLGQCLIFEASGIVRLAHRIKELEQEKSLQKKQQKEAKKKHVELIKDRRHFEQRISEMKEQSDYMMVQKFGRLLDLEKLETVTVNRNIEELKEKLRQNETLSSTELTVWDEKIRDAKDKITSLVKENTNRFEQLNILVDEKRQFEKLLDSRQKNLGSEFSGARQADVHEKQRLIQLVHLQAQEIEALKEEIMLLSRKGGHILPPAQPPMPPSSQGPRAQMRN